MPAGKYVIRLPIPDSNWYTREGQSTLLLPDEKLIPVTSGVLALLCLRKANRADPLQNGLLSCAEESARGLRVGLRWLGGRLDVYSYWVGYRDGNVWAGGVRSA